MNTRAHLAVLLCLLLNLSIFAQTTAYKFDRSLPAQPLNDDTELTVLQSRFGSRFSFSPAFADAATHTGALGYDSDQLREMIVGISKSGQTYCFRLGNKPTGAQYLQNQQIRLGMNVTELSGETPSGDKVVLRMIAPYTPSETLQDTDNLKTHLLPAYLIEVDVTNTKNDAEYDVLMGFKALPYDRSRATNLAEWRKNRANGEHYQGDMFFRDVAGPNSLLALSAKADDQAHFTMKGFNGIKTTMTVGNDQSATATYVYAAHHAGGVMQDEDKNQELVFYYNKFWRNIDEVLAYAWQNYDDLRQKSEMFENLLIDSKATPHEKWVVALTFRSDMANAMLLLDGNQQPRFYLVEGRFRHMSTIDVAHETEIAALFCPWRLKLQLEQWVSGYLSVKPEWVRSVRNADGSSQMVKEGLSSASHGPFLYHDVGDYPFVMHATAYNFGPFMAIEENATYASMLYFYWKLTGDDDFVRSHLGVLDVLMQSMINRDTDDSGLADVAVGWSTYDVSDAIKRSSENVYLGVKQLTGYLAAAELFEKLPITQPTTNIGDGQGIDGDNGIKWQNMVFNNQKLRAKQAEKYRNEAAKIVKSLRKAHRKYGYIPVSLNTDFEGWNQYSVVLPEGLWFAGLSGLKHPLLDKMVPALKSTYTQAFEKSQRDFGVLLSHKEEVTWFSKVMVSDIVASYWFDIDNSTAKFTYDWNKNNSQAYNDGAHSTTKPWTGYWYPRGISSLGYLLRQVDFKADKRADFLKNVQ